MTSKEAYELISARSYLACKISDLSLSLSGLAMDPEKQEAVIAEIGLLQHELDQLPELSEILKHI